MKQYDIVLHTHYLPVECMQHSQERLELFNNDAFIDSYRLRKSLEDTTFTPLQVTAFSEFMTKREQEYLDTLATQQKDVVNTLHLIQESWTQKGILRTPACLCAEGMLHTVAQILQKEALDYHTRGIPAAFAAYYDYLAGFIEVPNAILGGQHVLEGKGEAAVDYTVISMLKEYKTLPTAATDATAEYHSVENSHMASLLMQDPTGHMSVRYLIRELENEVAIPALSDFHRILPYQQTSLLLQGARFGKQVYTIYFAALEQKD